jgi:osmoprotectant transport system permease protein
MLHDALQYLTDSDNWRGANGIGAYATQQVLLSVTALAIAIAVALPVALWLGHIGHGGFLAVNISNVGRAIPVFAVLLFLALGPVGSKEFGPYGRAGLATLVALILFALPPIMTNAYVGMREVDRDTIEAARGMGMRGWQLFWSIELPMAAAVVMTGIRLALVQVWATATIAALVAGPGLGAIIIDGFNNHRTYEVFAGALLVAIGALLLEGIAFLAERRLDPMRVAYRRS